MIKQRSSFTVLFGTVLLGGLLCFPWPAKAGGTVIGWGGNVFGQIDPCAPEVVAIAAGDSHSLLLLQDGRVADCGRFNYDCPITVPPGLSNVVAVSAGDSHSMALKADGTVVVWGLNHDGQTNLPAGLTNVAAIAAGVRHSLVLLTDGTVVGWGNGGTKIPPGLSNVVAIAAGAGNNLALKADGTVVGWGFRADQTAALSVFSNAVAISAGDDSFYESWLVLKADGQVVSRGAYGGTTIIQGNAVAISCSRGMDHHISLALKEDGTVEGWGYNFYGGPNVPTGLSDVVAIAAGNSHDLALVGDGKPFIQNRLVDRAAVMGGAAYFHVEATGARPLRYQWRFNGADLVGATDRVLARTNLHPRQAGRYSVSVSNIIGGVTSESAVLSLIPLQFTKQPVNQTNLVGSTASLSVAVLGFQPLYYQWRLADVAIQGATNSALVLSNVQLSQAGEYSVRVSNAFGAIVSSTARLTVVPILLATQPQDATTFPGGTATVSVTAQGAPPLRYQWQFNAQDLPSQTNSALSLAGVQGHQAGLYRVFLNNPVGTVTSRSARLSVLPVAAWGSATLGQTTVPTILTNVLGLAAGHNHSLALTSDRQVVGWGLSTSGPEDLTNVVAIAAGSYSGASLALNDRGMVASWGGNYPTTPPADLSNVVATAAGGWHKLALRSDGTVVVWGLDDPITIRVPAYLTDVVAITAGQEHSLVLKSDGTVTAWGHNEKGQADVPSGLADVVAIAAGANHNLALRAGGRVTAWGYNYNGQASVPMGLTNVVAIAAGELHSMALTADGTVLVWGWSGATNPPVGLSNVVAIAAGGAHCLTIIADGPPEIHTFQINPAWNVTGFSVSVPTRSGRVYRLEYKESPEEVYWKALPLVAGNGTLQTLTDSTATGRQRFYRVRWW